MTQSISSCQSLEHTKEHNETQRQCSRNISTQEQWVSLAAGGALALYGVSNRSRWSLLSLLAGASLLYRGFSGHCKLYEGLGINTADSDDAGVTAQHGRKVKRSIHVNRDKSELYEQWRDLANLPKWMSHIESVQPLDSQRSHWEARGPLGKRLTWDAEIVTDRPGEVIAWQSMPGSQVQTAGSVHFRTPAYGEGTEIVVSVKYDPPGGAAIAELAYLLGQGLEQELEEDLRRFKQLLEAGEIATAAQYP